MSTVTPEKVGRRHRTLSVFSTLSSRSHVQRYDDSGVDEVRIPSTSFVIVSDVRAPIARQPHESRILRRRSTTGVACRKQRSVVL